MPWTSLLEDRCSPVCSFIGGRATKKKPAWLPAAGCRVPLACRQWNGGIGRRCYGSTESRQCRRDACLIPQGSVRRCVPLATRQWHPATRQWRPSVSHRPTRLRRFPPLLRLRGGRFRDGKLQRPRRSLDRHDGQIGVFAGGGVSFHAPPQRRSSGRAPGRSRSPIRSGYWNAVPRQSCSQAGGYLALRAE